MARPVAEDARGIVAPDAGLRRFRLDRFDPSPVVARFVDRYWVVGWDLTGRPSHTQHVLAHPVVNISFDRGGPGVVNGVPTRLGARTLTGRGRALGVMFRPAGFRPFLRRPMSTITDRTLGLEAVIGADRAAAMAEAVAAAPDEPAMAAAADRHLEPLVPTRPRASEDTSALVERVAAEPGLLRVGDLADMAGCTARQLQRRFADHVGIGPKAMIRRYRLHEAAERARSGDGVDWAAVAADLGYADQAHLTRDFTALLGLPPGRYLARNRVDSPG
jgi:AraC-like DNA-binding protein